MTRTTTARILGTLLISGGTAPALAQDAPSGDPENGESRSIREQMEQAERLVPREPGEVEAFAPEPEDTTNPVRPGLTGGLDWLGSIDPGWTSPEGSGLLPERVFVNSVRGRVVRGPHGMLIFVPDPADELVLQPTPIAAPTPAAGESDPDATEATTGDAEPTMSEAESTEPTGPTEPVEPRVPTRAVLLLPCGELERFEEYVFAGERETEAILTGQVFVYDERNYILPTLLRRARPGSFVPGDSTPAESPPADTAASEADAATGEPAREIGDDPDVEELLAELDRRPPFSPPAAAAPRSSGEGGEDTDRRERRVAPAAPDGEYVAARRGRLVRAGDGTWSFVLDTDNPRSAATLEYTLLPNRTLQSVESVALTDGDGTAGVMSGRVYRFRGRVYMLPTLFQREHREGVDPLQ